MRPDELRNHLRQQPFRPFRFFLTNGASYDVPHPEMMFVTRTTVVVAAELGENDLPDNLVYCDPLHVTHVEPIDRSTRRRGKTKRT